MSKMHMSLDVKGALSQPDSRLKGFTKDGIPMTPKQVRAYLTMCDFEGKKVIPMSSECDNFDYQKGCLGHD